MSEDVTVWTCHSCGQRRLSVDGNPTYPFPVISDGEDPRCVHSQAGPLRQTVLSLVLVVWDERAAA